MASPIIVQKNGGVWRATLHLPPFNLWGPAFYPALIQLLQDLENDPQVKVIIFDSDIPDFFISHYDLQHAAEIPPEHIAQWPAMLLKLTTLPVVSIAAIRGRARGVGSEFIMACDVRFGSKEQMVLSQAEVSFSLIPGGGGLELMPRILTRPRALEIVLGSDEFDAVTAEKYGYINRAIPDEDFDAFVNRFANRVAGWDKAALSEAKRLINKRYGMPKEEDMKESFQAMMGLWMTPRIGGRIEKAVAAGLETDVKVERTVGEFMTRFPVD
jgi:enoyl-CoA hydratase/carnithine racemase